MANAKFMYLKVIKIFPFYIVYIVVVVREMI